jgi:signal peptidase I
MLPELRSGQVVLLDSHYYRRHALERGDIVAFEWEGTTYVKRVHALSGETVRLVCNYGDCRPIALGQKQKAERLAERIPSVAVRTRVVPPDHFYCLGDYASASVDSRELGPIPISAILGRVHSF